MLIQVQLKTLSLTGIRMLGWVQRVLPQPPRTPQKTEEAAGPQPETESKPEAKPQPEPEPQPKPEPEPEPEPESEPEPAPEETLPEVQTLVRGVGEEGRLALLLRDSPARAT